MAQRREREDLGAGADRGSARRSTRGQCEPDAVPELHIAADHAERADGTRTRRSAHPDRRSPSDGWIRSCCLLTRPGSWRRMSPRRQATPSTFASPELQTLPRWCCFVTMTWMRSPAIDRAAEPGIVDRHEVDELALDAAPSVWTTRTAAVCAIASMISTPGITGSRGKCPWKKVLVDRRRS